MNHIQKGIHDARSQITHLAERLHLLPDSMLTQNLCLTYIDVIKHNMTTAESYLDSAVSSLNQESKKKETTKLPVIKLKSTHEKNVIEMKIFEKEREGERGRGVGNGNGGKVVRRNQAWMKKYEPPGGDRSFVRNPSYLKQKSISTSFVRYEDRVNAVLPREEKYLEQLAKSSVAKQTVEIEPTSLILTLANGSLTTTTNQYSIFSYVYRSALPKINQYTKQLWDILQEHGIKKVSLQGKKLGCVGMVEHPVQHMIECIEEADIRQYLLQKYKQVNDGEARARAAAKIQSLWRMNSIRKQYIEFKGKVLVIQRFAKRYAAKKLLAKQMNNKNQETYNKFLDNQTYFKANYEKIQSQPHFQLHICSFPTHETKRLSVQNIEQKNNIQLTRLFRLKDPNISIILVANTDKILSVIQHYQTILGHSGISYEGRLFFISPENRRKFPSRFSLPKLLYYSPKSLLNIKRIIKGRNCIYIPGYPSLEDIKICTELGCYLLSSDPLKNQSFCSRYEQKKLFMEAGLPVLPFVSDFIEMGELTRALGEVVVKNPEVESWVFKCNGETGGQGVGVYTLPRGIVAVLGKIQEQHRRERGLNEEGVRMKKGESVELRHFRSIIDIIDQTLLPKLKLPLSSPYKTPEHFLKAFLKSGGIIQSYCQHQQSKCLSVCFFLSANGTPTILTTFEKLQGEPFVNIASKFPQQTVPHSVLEDCCEKLSEKLVESDGFGYYVLDLLCTRRRKEEEYFVHAIGLDPYLNGYVGGYFYFDAVVGGRCVGEGKYVVGVGEEGKKSLNSSFFSSGTTRKKERDQEKLQARRYVYAPCITYPHFDPTTLKSLRRTLALETIQYDFGKKQGVDVLMVDEAIAGIFGFMAIYENTAELLGTLENSLVAMKKMFTKKKPNLTDKQYTNKNQITISDLINLCRKLMKNSKHSKP